MNVLRSTQPTPPLIEKNVLIGPKHPQARVIRLFLDGRRFPPSLGRKGTPWLAGNKCRSS